MRISPTSYFQEEGGDQYNFPLIVTIGIAAGLIALGMCIGMMYKK